MTPTKIHLTFLTDASGSVLIDKASPEPFVGSEEFVRAQGWRPIETAPRDGSTIILLIGETIPDLPYIRCGSYISETEGESLGYWEGWVVWSDRGEDYNVEFLDAATHWMPIPPSPSEKGVG